MIDPVKMDSRERLLASNKKMIDPVKMDTKERGGILQPNLHDKYQPIFDDLGI
jgi:hypothetical protein